MHSLTSNTRSLQWDDQHANPTSSRTTSPDGSRAIVGPDTVGNPFLSTVDNIMIPLSLSGSLDIRDIRTSWQPCQYPLRL